MSASNVTVGIDIGTSSVKAIAADDDGNVVARARIPHDFSVPSPQRFEHDAKVAWHAGPRRALEALGAVKPRAVSVAAMVPSLTAVDDAGIPCTPGLLYGDERGHQPERSAPTRAAASSCSSSSGRPPQRPDARGYWMAQAVANNALTGDPAISMIVAATAAPLFDWTRMGRRPGRVVQRPRRAVARAPPARAGARRGASAIPDACSRAARSTRSPNSSSPTRARAATCS